MPDLTVTDQPGRPRIPALRLLVSYQRTLLTNGSTNAGTCPTAQECCWCR